MKTPETPPNWREQLKELFEDPQFLENASVRSFVDKHNRRVTHWDRLRHIPLPEAFKNHEQAWSILKFSRISQMQTIPISGEDLSERITYWNPKTHSHFFHKIDMRAGGNIGAMQDYGIQNGDERYLINALMEEAISSTLLEGAATTRKKAKKLLQSRKRPRNQAEQMVVNNYEAIREIQSGKNERLTPEMLLELQSILTRDTLNDPGDVGRFRDDSDEIEIRDRRDDSHVFTPPTDDLHLRIQQICEFANRESSKEFIHPVLKAILLHFAVAFAHPFPDGNGRTARAVFYWFMLKKGYWLFQYLPISRIFLRTPGQYKRAFLFTETDDGDVTYFVDFHLNAIIRAIDDLLEYLAEKQKEIKQASVLLRDYPGLNHRQTSLLSAALKDPDRVFTIREHEAIHRVSYPTARSDLIELAEKNLFQFIMDGNQMLFYAPGDFHQKLKDSGKGSDKSDGRTLEIAN